MADPRLDRLAEIDAELGRLRPDYEAAKIRVTAPAAREQQDAAWGELREVLAAAGSAGVTGETALFVLGRVTQIVAHATPREALKILADYEALRERRRKLEAAVPPQPKENATV